MDSEKLYRVQEEDLPKLEELLCRSFAADPLYVELIPDEEVRKRLMPELFECDMEEFFETCEIYADSPEINGIIVVDDESEPYNPVHYYLTEAAATLRTDGYLIKEDPSLKTFWNFAIFKFQMDGPAPPGGAVTYHLSGCEAQDAAPRNLGSAFK